MKTWAISLKTDDPTVYVLVRCSTAYEAWREAGPELPGSPSFVDVCARALGFDVLGPVAKLQASSRSNGEGACIP